MARVPLLAPFSTSYAPTGMVSSIDGLASGAGVAALRAGGTAADAAIAASAVLTVTAQHMCGLGGDLFALVHRSGEARPAVLNASGRAGSGADPERLRAEGHVSMPLTGDVRSVPVPGCVDGWVTLHARFGRLPLGEVLEPARRLAAEGFPVLPRVAAAVRAVAHLPGAADYTAGGTLVPGALVRRPGVARALVAVAGGGRKAFYGGEFGERLLALGEGEYAEADLERSQADWVEPLGLEAWGRRLWTVPPNSQGYLTLAGAWIAERLELPDPGDGLWAHLLVEAARQAAYDRNDVLHEGADGAALTAEGRLEPRLAAIERERAAVLGDSYGAGGTIFLCAADGEGMGVSLIQSNFRGWGSQLIVPELGIFLQNRGAGFLLERGHPAEYGPGRRPPHTLSPSLVTAPSGDLDLLVGTMGGHSQPQILLQLLARRLAAGQSPGEAVASPRWVLDGPGVDTWVGRGQVTVRVENHAPAAWFRGLEARGHRVERAPSWAGELGHAHLIAVEDGGYAGAADPRSEGGVALGY